MDFDAMQKIALLLFVSLVMYDESGGGWTRTTERIPGQIYSLLQLPLCDSPNTNSEPVDGLEPPTG